MGQGVFTMLDWHTFFLGGPDGGVSLFGTGVEVPPFIVLCCTLLFVFWGIAIAGLLKACVSLRRIIGNLTQGVRAIETKTHYFDSRGLEEISQLLASKEQFAEGFAEFSKSLIVENSEDGAPARVFNTRPIDDFLSERMVLSSRIHQDFYVAVPALLTSAGLLVTFLAILCGLSEVSVDDISGKVQGVDVLVSNLSGKFLSSVVALALAIIFTLVEKRQTRAVVQAYRELIKTIASRFQLRTAEQLIREQISILLDQHRLQRRAVADLPQLLHSGIADGMCLALRSVAEGNPAVLQITGGIEKIIALLQEPHKASGTALPDSLSDLSVQMTSSLMEPIRLETTNLAALLGDTVRSLGTMNSQTIQVVDKVDRLLDSFSSTSTKQAEITNNQVSEILATTERAMDRLQQASLNSTEVAKNTAASMLSALDTSARANIGSMRLEMEQLSKQLHELMGHSFESIADKMAEMAHGVDRSLNTTMGNMRKVVELQEENVKAMVQTRLEMAKSLEAFQSTTAVNLHSLAEFQQAGNSLEKLTSSAASLVREISAAQTSTGSMISAAQSKVEELAKVLSGSSAVLGQYSQVFDVLDSKVGELLNRIAANIQGYSQVMNESMENNIKTFDELSATAANSLALVVGELGEQIATLVEALEVRKKNCQ